MSIDLNIPRDLLVHRLRELGHDAAEVRQVARRLSELFPRRFSELQYEFRHLSGGKRDRVCLTDPRYRKALEELVSERSRAMRLRVEYETHKMLYEARQSLGVR